jgi:hypothetical protein
MNLPDLGSVALGITDVRKESVYNNEEDLPMEITHTYDFDCSCFKCNKNDRALRNDLNFSNNSID